MIKYRTCYDGEIKLIEIDKETDRFVVLLTGKRESKISSYYCYFDTLDEAKKYLIGKFDKEIELSNLAIKLATERKQRALDYKDVQS